MSENDDILKDIQAALVAAGIGQITDSKQPWMIYRNVMADTDPKATNKVVNDQAICLYETSGEVPEEGWSLDRPAFQIAVRGNPDDYDTVRAKLLECFDLLHAGETNVGTAYVYIYGKESGSISLGQDERRRTKLVNNFRVMRVRPGNSTSP